MTWRRPPYDHAIADLEAFVRTAWSPIGIVISGSIVRGEAGPTSDFDVFVVHREPWRQRVQRRFAGVPAELFLNPPHKIRGYFASEHATGRPCTAHMFATGEVLGEADPVIRELIGEARDWLAKPLPTLTAAQDAQRRYAPVDLIDDARDVIDTDPAAAALLLARAVVLIVEYAFVRAGQRQPRRKATVTALVGIDPTAGALVRRWEQARGRAALDLVIELARHVLALDSFFEWESDREPLPT